MKACRNCQHWNEHIVISGRLGGECRRRAPLPGLGAGGHASWPTTQSDDWCGEITPKPWAPERVDAFSAEAVARGGQADGC